MGIFTSLGDAFSTPSPAQGVRKPLPATANYGDDVENKRINYIYNPDPNSWYTAKPYGFKFQGRGNNSSVMFLPISPSNLTISTSFATNIITTLYGTVEEHSDVRYYDIVIEGTTGMAPQFVEPTSADVTSAYNNRLSGRAKFPISGSAPLGGFLSSTIGQISNALGQLGKAVSTIGSIFGNGPTTNSALYNDQTGYLAFHNLYRFLLVYKKDAAGLYFSQPYTQHPLIFFNYKDGNQYNVAIRNFTLKRTAENPMLYYYSINMRGYNISDSGGIKGTDDLSQRLVDLGLNGISSSSLLSNVKSVSSSAKAVLASAKNGINLFGR